LEFRVLDFSFFLESRFFWKSRVLEDLDSIKEPACCVKQVVELVLMVELVELVLLFDVLEGKGNLPSDYPGTRLLIVF
jgi:hypothetical protein